MKKKIILHIFTLIFASAIHSQVSVGVNTNQPLGVFHIDSKGNSHDGTTGNTVDDILIDNQGYMGIGLINPQYKLDIKVQSGTNGLRIVDGLQKKSKVIVSDAQGYGHWSDLGSMPIVKGVLGTGVDFDINNDLDPGIANKWVSTGSYIDLPPGRWFVMVIMLLSAENITGGVWVVSSFFPQTDIEGSPFISGPIEFPNDIRAALLNGVVLINNQTNATKRYAYILRRPTGPTGTLKSFGGTTWGENNIIALKVGE